MLRALRNWMPGEDFLYYGDSRHAPYGDRPLQEVQALSADAAAWLLARGVKAIVIACNTATSAAAAFLRETYPDLPIIGTEPALKPAVERHPGGRVLVMATEMTLHEQKFRRLMEQFTDRAVVDPVPCPGLMEFVERGVFSGPQLKAYLKAHLQPHLTAPVDAVVLGCTHYPLPPGRHPADRRPPARRFSTAPAASPARLSGGSRPRTSVIPGPAAAASPCAIPWTIRRCGSGWSCCCAARSEAAR